MVLCGLFINLVMSCQRLQIAERPDWKQEVYLVDTISIPNSMVFDYRGNRYVCDSTVITTTDLRKGDIKKIISSPYVYHFEFHYIFGLPDHLRDSGYRFTEDSVWYETVETTEYFGYYNCLYCDYDKVWKIKNEKSKEIISIRTFRRNPDFYNLYLMNIAYFNWAFVYRVFDGAATPLKSVSPSNRYVRIVYPVCKKRDEDKERHRLDKL